MLATKITHTDMSSIDEVMNQFKKILPEQKPIFLEGLLAKLKRSVRHFFPPILKIWRDLQVIL